MLKLVLFYLVLHMLVVSLDTSGNKTPLLW